MPRSITPLTGAEITGLDLADIDMFGYPIEPDRTYVMDHVDLFGYIEYVPEPHHGYANDPCPS